MPSTPGLTPSEAHSAMAYYFDNTSEIDGELQAELDQIEGDPPVAKTPAFVRRMRAQGRL